MKFINSGDSHHHSLQVLNALYEYSDFMESISTMADLGCGAGEDLEWWATRTTHDDNQQPLNIQCQGIDLLEQLPVAKKHENIIYQRTDFEDKILAPKHGFDILWCHDAFQYCVNPIQTLSRWWHITSPGGMLYIGLPITIDFYRRQFDYHLPSGCYYHYSMVSLIYMLATAGWDCRHGFFKQHPTDNWIHAIVYKSTQDPLDIKTANWHKLVELNLLPDSAVRSIHAHNYLRQQDLVIPWVDQSLTSMAIK